MKTHKKLPPFALLAVFVATTGCAREVNPDNVSKTSLPSAGLTTTKPPPSAPAPEVEIAKALPKLVNLGADKCIPCKQMVPVRNALTAEYAGQLEVTFIDVWADREAGEKHRIRIIPTQIILDAEGRELFRHEGYWPKEEIVARFHALGIPLIKKEPPAASGSDRT